MSNNKTFSLSLYLFTGSFNVDIYCKQKLMNSCNLSSPTYLERFYITKSLSL